MRIGFTGTQAGMSNRQKAEFKKLIRGATELHHGDCIGADEEAHLIAMEVGLTIGVHPPSDPKKRAFVTTRNGDATYSPKPYLMRNRDIVDTTDELIAAPLTNQEQLRSGTWSTVRYARRIGKKVTVLPR